MAALAFNVSKMVSTIRRSTPPSNNPCTCSEYAATSWSKSTFRYSGLETSGDNDAVLFVGPMHPQTKRGFSGVLRVTVDAALQAISADALFNKYACSSNS